MNPDSEYLFYVHVLLLHLILAILSEGVHLVDLRVPTLLWHPAQNLTHSRASRDDC